MRTWFRSPVIESNRRDEALRTNLWLIPAIETVIAIALFVATVNIDEAAFHGRLSHPPHRHRDPTPGGDRQYRARPERGD